MFNSYTLIYISGQSRASKTVKSQSRLIFWEGGSSNLIFQHRVLSAKVKEELVIFFLSSLVKKVSFGVVSEKKRQEQT